MMKPLQKSDLVELHDEVKLDYEILLYGLFVSSSLEADG
jgi:hypothetical protein